MGFYDGTIDTVNSLSKRTKHDDKISKLMRLSLRRLKIVINCIIVFTFCNCKAQQTVQQGDNFQEIIGTWIVEGSTNESRWVFNSNGTMQDYSEGGVIKTYYWEIITAVVGGFKSSYPE